MSHTVDCYILSFSLLSWLKITSCFIKFDANLSIHISKKIHMDSTLKISIPFSHFVSFLSLDSAGAVSPFLHIPGVQWGLALVWVRLYLPTIWACCSFVGPLVIYHLSRAIFRNTTFCATKSPIAVFSLLMPLKSCYWCYWELHKQQLLIWIVLYCTEKFEIIQFLSHYGLWNSQNGL